MKVEEKIFTVGTEVEWKSQAGGSVTKKTGTIVGIIEKDAKLGYLRGHATRILGSKLNKYLVMFDGYHAGRKTRYLVEVRKSDKAQPRLYCPVAKLNEVGCDPA